MWKVSDAVVHPAHGPGIVTRIGQNGHGEPGQVFYTIELVEPARTTVTLSVENAADRGLRDAMAAEQVADLWAIFGSQPGRLPTAFKARRARIESRLDGPAPEIAKAVRDLAWRKKRRGHLSRTERRSFHRAIQLLAQEISVVEGVAPGDAEARVRQRLRRGLDDRARCAEAECDESAAG